MPRRYKKKTKSPGGKFGRTLGILLIILIIIAALWRGGKLDFSFLNSTDTWYLTLVNSTNPVPSGWKTDLTELKDGERVDSRTYPYLQQMFDDCRADGLLPVVKSSYRTSQDQQKIFDEKTDEFIAQGYLEDEAEKQANKWAAKAGYSEHQLGLAVDIDSEDTLVCSNEAVWEWLRTHCDAYGFILRYPSGKEEVTQCSYEPWHFRYVGKEAAKTIMDGSITLEEYLANEKTK